MKKQKTTFWTDRRVLVTGATGFLGSWLTEDLLESGASVVALVRDKVPASPFFTKPVFKKAICADGALEDYFLMERLLNEYEIETVFHVAAQTIVGVANANPLSTFETNIRGSWNLLEACRRSPRVKRIIVASSDKAYGDQKILPYTEDAPLQGRHPYDVSKSCVDLICRSYYETYKLPVSVTRCGNLYGGGDMNFNRIVPGTIRSLLREERPVIRSDGKLVRDYFYVKDAAQAYMRLAELFDEKAVAGEAFNFSNENQMSALEICERIIKLMKAEHLKPQVMNEAKGEIRHQYLSAAKARRVLGWKPRFSLDEGLRESIAWYTQLLSA